jgi:putative SOS response-associated peptidase YedK
MAIAFGPRITPYYILSFHHGIAANELVAEIHDRMVRIHSRMWWISTRVNKPENDNRSVLEPIALATSAA